MRQKQNKMIFVLETGWALMVSVVFKHDFFINTQNKRNSNLVYVSKTEYVHKVNIFGLKMMVKSGLKKIILKFLHAEAIFY